MMTSATTGVAFHAMRHFPYAFPTAPIIENFINVGPSSWPIDHQRADCLFGNPLFIRPLLHGRVTHVITSPAERAQATARVIARHLNLKAPQVYDLRPRYLGPWSYYRQEATTLCRCLPQGTPNYFKTVMRLLEQRPSSEMESSELFAQRMQKNIWSILRQHPHENLLWITHGSCLRQLKELCPITTRADFSKNSNYGFIFQGRMDASVLNKSRSVGHAFEDVEWYYLYPHLCDVHQSYLHELNNEPIYSNS